MNKISQKVGKIENVESKQNCTIFDACNNILLSPTLKDKITIYTDVNWDVVITKPNISQESLPGRPNNLIFSDEKIKFPKDHEFKQNTSKAKALHFFANHELLAIEVMAKMILLLPDDGKFLLTKKEIWKTLQDEQKHLQLYRNRLNEIGYDFGDFPVNDYFWKIFKDVKSYESYFALMSMTFEAANLDFSAFYAKLFEKHGDFKSSQLMEQIFRDEVFHVQLGYHFIAKNFQAEVVWKNYVESLPWPITPARSKGIHYKEEHRKSAGYTAELIKKINSYKDNFSITERKR